MSAAPIDLKAFDAYAAQYDAALAKGLSVSGEKKEYFARGRILWLSKKLATLEARPASVLDFGCGTGTAAPVFSEVLSPERYLGVDVSAKSLEIATHTYGNARTAFTSIGVYEPKGEFSLAFCNGVFHHVPLSERAAAVNYIVRALSPGGLFAFWENNPWNPGTRLVMKRIPFDRDAIPLSPPGARKLLRQAGFKILRTDYMFIFPRLLKTLRGLEPLLSRFPFGAQYQILCQKPL